MRLNREQIFSIAADIADVLVKEEFIIADDPPKVVAALDTGRGVTRVATSPKGLTAAVANYRDKTLTIIEQKGDPSKLTINMSYAYAASYQKPISVPQSLILLMTRYGANVRLTRPPEFKLMPEIVAQAEENARKAHGSFEIVEDFEEGMAGADVVYAKAWGSMLTTSDHVESAKISGKYKNWIVDARRMEMADEDAIYMHPLPADRNIEVSDGVIDGRWSAVFDQAENRVHTIKAVMIATLGRQSVPASAPSAGRGSTRRRK